MADDDPLDDVRMVAMTAAAATARVVETAAREAQKAREDRQRAAEQEAQAARRAAAMGTSAVRGVQVPVGGHDLPNSSTPRTTATSPAYTERQAVRDAELEQLRQAKDWASPDRRRDYNHEHMGSDSIEGWAAADQRLIREWLQATGQVNEQPQGKRLRLDELTPDQRAQADQLLAEVSGGQPGGYDSQRADRDRAMREAGVADEPRQAKTTADLLNGRDPGRAATEGTKTNTAPARYGRAAERQRGRG